MRPWLLIGSITRTIPSSPCPNKHASQGSHHARCDNKPAARPSSTSHPLASRHLAVSPASERDLPPRQRSIRAQSACCAVKGPQSPLHVGDFAKAQRSTHILKQSSTGYMFTSSYHFPPRVPVCPRVIRLTRPHRRRLSRFPPGPPMRTAGAGPDSAGARGCCSTRGLSSQSALIGIAKEIPRRAALEAPAR